MGKVGKFFTFDASKQSLKIELCVKGQVSTCTRVFFLLSDFGVWKLAMYAVCSRGTMRGRGSHVTGHSKGPGHIFGGTIRNNLLKK